MSVWDPSIPHHLNLSYCNIWHIHPLALFPVPTLQTFSMEGNHHILQGDLKAALKQLDVADLEDANFSHMNVTDILDFVHHFKAGTLKALRLSHNRIQRIPKRTFFFLVNLKYMDLSYNEISAVENFEGLTKVEYLSLANNNLERLDEMMFEGLHELKVLDISHNSLTHLNDEPFLNLFNLNTIDLSCNQIQQFDINAGLESLEVLLMSWNRLTNVRFAQHLRRLHTFDASHNIMTRITEELFSHEQKINLVNFSSNAIFDISSAAFHSASYDTIDLSSNRLTSLSHHGWELVKVLLLNDNSIYNVTPTAFSKMSTLQELHFQRNQLYALPARSLSNLRHLKLLDLGSNPLGTFLDLPETQLITDTLERLESLRLSDTGMNVVTAQLLRHAVSLQHLDLSRNKLTRIQSTALAHCTKLSEINLARNKLTEFDEAILQGLSELSHLDISENPLDCTCSLVPLCNRLFSGRLSVSGLHNRTLYRCATPDEWRGVALAEFYMDSTQCSNFHKVVIIVAVGCSATLIVLVLLGVFVCRYQSWQRRKVKVTSRKGPTIVNYRFVDDTTLTSSSNSSSNSSGTGGCAAAVHGMPPRQLSRQALTSKNRTMRT